MCSECIRLGHICEYHRRMRDAQQEEALLVQESIVDHFMATAQALGLTPLERREALDLLGLAAERAGSNEGDSDG